MRKLSLALVLAASIIIGGVAIADDTTLFNPPVKTLACFRNGLGFVYKSGTAKLKDGTVEMEGIPSAVAGTVWFGSLDVNNPVVEVKSYSKLSGINEVLPETIGDLFALNAGKKVLVRFSRDNVNSDSVTGIIMKVPIPKIDSEYPYPTKNPFDFVFLLVEKEGKKIVSTINYNTIYSFDLPEDAIYTDKKMESFTPFTKVKLKKNTETAGIWMQYMRNGYFWSPSYLLDISNEKDANLKLEAVLVNNAENIENTDVSFVVGYPTFMYSDKITPLFIQETANALDSAMTKIGYKPASAMLGLESKDNNNGGSYNANRGGGGWSPSATNSAEKILPGERSEDLYVYLQKGVSLKKNESARYSIFSSPCFVEAYLFLGCS